LADLKRDIAALADPERAKNLARFFKTGEGEYGEGDRFLGLTVPMQNRLAKKYRELPLKDVLKLLQSPIHEHRLTALMILRFQYERGTPAMQQAIFKAFLAHTRHVNNWDLVDSSAPYIVGMHLAPRPRTLLRRLAKSKDLWERRIAIVATLGLMRQGHIEDTFAIAEILLPDEHDLIHKATGWMLREAGKRSEPALLAFLEKNYAAMPRTALRYAIERFPQAQRKRLLAGLFD
ncbi:MAG TPA: DNA alkylation repair protein, partial [Candidatus Binataceae bacterium]|nr:DNA alkylation repair protein [Candidatus Binataceae bacterium]